MDTRTLNQKLQQILARPAPKAGLTRLPGLGILSFTMGHKIRSVSLPQSAVIFVLDGAKTIFCGQDSMRIRAGEGFLLPARMETTVENTPDGHSGRYSALCLTYGEAMIARAATGRPPNNGFPTRPLEALQIPCDAIIESSLRHLMEMAAATPENEPLLALCREELLLVVADKTDCMPLLWQAASSWSSRCSSVMGMDPGREWTIRGIAEKLGTSERTLRRHLNNEGDGFTQILREVRLNAGLALLQVGNTSVGEAAYRCGYNSASRFAGLFRERFGVSPSEVLQYTAVSGQPLAES